MGLRAFLWLCRGKLGPSSPYGPLPKKDAGLQDARVVTSGNANCEDQSCTLELEDRFLPTGTQRVCLFAKTKKVDLAGNIPTCRVNGHGPSCTRDDQVANIPLLNPIFWNLCR